MRTSLRFLKTGFVSIALLLMATGASLATPVFSITGPTSVSGIGTVFSLDVSASGLTDLYAYQLSISFNPAIIQALGVSEGGFLQTGGSTFFSGGTIDNVVGNISFVVDTLLGPTPGVSGNGLLAGIDFRSVGFGSTTIGLFDVLALDSNLNVIPVQSRPGVLTVPEPGSLALLVIAALGLIGFRSSKSSRVESGELSPA